MVENRTAAVLAYLPKWKGFLVGEAVEEMDATKALMELSKVVDGLTNSWVKESYLSAEKKRPAFFNIKTVNLLKLTVLTLISDGLHFDT